MNEISFAKSCFDIADMSVNFRNDIRSDIGNPFVPALTHVQNRRAWAHSLFGIEHGLENGVRHLQFAAAFFRRRFGVCHHRCNALADETDHLIENACVIGVHDRKFVARRRIQPLRRVLVRQYGVDPWHCERVALVDRNNAGVRMGRSHELHVKQTGCRQVERVSYAARNNSYRRRRLDVATDRRTPVDRFDMRNTVDCVFDHTIAGAAAQIPLHRPTEIATLRLIQTRNRDAHAGRAEPALKALRLQQRLLNGMKGSILGETFDGRNLATINAKGWKETAVNRFTIEENRTGTAITGVAALFHSEPTELAQQRSQALAGTWLLRLECAIDPKFHDANALNS
jgi:hypothetical protein